MNFLYTCFLCYLILEKFKIKKLFIMYFLLRDSKIKFEVRKIHIK